MSTKLYDNYHFNLNKDVLFLITHKCQPNE